MTSVDAALIETLLNMSESDVLDFKRDQYPLARATDDQKSELMKDILAFANAWKTTDAHIVIGADENQGGRARVVGVVNHLNDADIQQIVNTKTNLPVAFEYVPVLMDGKQVALVRIKAEQQRPLFLRKGFGNLKANVVYVRRGSSTVEALPDEVARMGASMVVSTMEPVVSVEMADPDTRKRFGAQVILASKLLTDPPPSSRSSDNALAAYSALAMQVGIATRGRGPDYLRRVAAYKREIALLSRVGLLSVQRSAVSSLSERADMTALKTGVGTSSLDDNPRKNSHWNPLVTHASEMLLSLQYVAACFIASRSAVPPWLLSEVIARKCEPLLLVPASERSKV
jgi:hypothetical protein